MKVPEALAVLIAKTSISEVGTVRIRLWTSLMLDMLRVFFDPWSYPFNEIASVNVTVNVAAVSVVAIICLVLCIFYRIVFRPCSSVSYVCLFEAWFV